MSRAFGNIRNFSSMLEEMPLSLLVKILLDTGDLNAARVRVQATLEEGIKCVNAAVWLAPRSWRKYELQLSLDLEVDRIIGII